MNEKINGFLILRKSLDKTKPYGKIYRIENKEYRGMERLHLEDVIDEYYEKKLPSAIASIVRMNDDESNDLLFMRYIRDYDSALKVLDYVNQKNDLNELIVISSDVLSREKAAIDFDNGRIEWLGYDIIPFGGSSIILNGLFFKPEYFSKWIEIINGNGLFTNKDKLHEYIEDYSKCAKNNIVEYYDLTGFNFDAIRIGRVL